MSSLWPRREDSKMAFLRDSPDSWPSHLEKSVSVRGILDTEGELHIHGNVSGRINAGRVVVGSDGCVEGDIVARFAQIGGRMTGRIFALDVILDSTADVRGRVFHHTVTVASGARIDGRMPWRPLNYFETLEQLPETQP